MGHFEVVARRIELSIEAIENPRIARNDAQGQGRTLLQNSKTREIGNLIEKLAYCQTLVQTDEQQEWLNSIKATLQEKNNEVFNPPMIEVGDRNGLAEEDKS